jgi:GntR family transcriptional regulator, histidine utilization repressor
MDLASVSPPPPASAPYAKVKRALKDGLASGRWTPGELMPSEAQLVAQFGVSRMTVNRALRELQTEGLVERVQGVGTFAAQLHPVSSKLTLRDLREEIIERGHRHEAEVHLLREEAASDALPRQLGLGVDAPVFHSLIVHLENGVPLQCEDRYVNPVWAPEYLRIDFTQITPTNYLLQVAPLWQAQYSVEAARPTAQEARLLRIDRSDPCLVVVRRTISRDVPVTLARLVYPGSRYSLQGEFRP